MQCYRPRDRCDAVHDCANGVDEEDCDSKSNAVRHGFVFVDPPQPPAILNFSGDGKFTLTQIIVGNTTVNDSLYTSRICPETHFQCHGGGNCLPVYVRCNEVYDCPDYEDEAHCDRFTCPGFYRCRGSQACLHPSHVCDGWPQCPQHDDELLCNFTCPERCTFYGLAFTCTDPAFPAHLFTGLRYLDASDSGLTPSQLTDNVLLIYLSLVRCGLAYIGNLTLPNLRSLDLRHNRLRHASFGVGSTVNNLQVLLLADNPLLSLFLNGPMNLPHLVSLELSNVHIKALGTESLVHLVSLQNLNLSNTHMERIEGPGFQFLTKLRTVDVQGSPLSVFPPGLLQGLRHLEAVYSDNYRLCCRATLPADFDDSNCHTHFDELSSCESLLRSNVYRVVLTLFAVFGIVGNIGSLAIRIHGQKGGNKSGFSVLVCYLCVADLLMSLYLVIIGLADRVYQDRYLWEDTRWRRSFVCNLAGFLSFTSNEVSAAIICLITVDRFLVLRFPFSRIHFYHRSAHLVSAGVFIVGFIISAIPWFPDNKHWDFYGQNGICIPLPFTTSDFPGHRYSFGIMIVLNLVLFVLIAAGQASIFLSVRTSAMPDMNVTRRYTIK